MGQYDDLTNRPLAAARFCAVDVETSSLTAASRVVEVGAVRFDLSGSREEFSSMVNPCEPISNAATEIHGITDEMVRNVPRAPDVLPGLLNFMQGCVFIAHYAPFDTRKIADELYRMDSCPPPVPVVCTVRLARALVPGLKSYSLGRLVSSLGIEAGTAHSALPDAAAAADVFLTCVSGLPRNTAVGALPGLMGSFDSVAPLCGRPVADGADELDRFAAQRLTVEMEYQKWNGPVVVVVTPHYTYSGGEHRYLAAYCHRDRMRKTYRVDRIRSVRPVPG